MKEVKKIVLTLFSIITLNFVSAYAYAGSYNNFGMGAFFQNTFEYLPMTIAFLLIFWAFTFAINRTRIKNGWVFALILSLFSVYGLTKLNIPIDDLFYKIGFNEELLLTIGPWIVLGLAMLIVWKWGFGRLLIIFGLIFLGIGIFKIAAESGAAILIGAITLLIGLMIYKKEMRRRRLRREMKNLGIVDRHKVKSYRREDRSARLAKWNRAGRVIGKYGVGPGIWAGKKAGQAVGWTGKTAWKGTKMIGQDIRKGAKATGRDIRKLSTKRLRKNKSSKFEETYSGYHGE